MFGKSSFGSTGSTFGSTGSSLFGQNKPTTNLFGQQNTTTQGSSLFGQKSTTNLFGQSTPTAGTSIFGSTQTASNTGTSLFGQSKPSLFGGSSTTGTSLFGSSTTPSGGLFGSTASTVNGTTIKFEPLVSSDTMMKNGSQTTIQTKHMCITAMKAYEGKSIEELRIDDYIANRKTPSATGGLFGSSTTTNTAGSIFGSTPAKPSLFGSSTTTTSPFGATQGTSLFGQNNNNATAGSSLFGSKPAGSIFGSPATSTASTFGTTTGGLFGSTGTSAFGTTQPQQQTGSLFGGSSFGTTTTTTSAFSFGSTTNTTSSPFGQTATSTTGLFGSNTATNTGSLFGKPAGTGTFSFGGSSNATFGQAATGGGLFGSTQKPGGLFGSTTGTTGGSVFGSQPAQQSTGLFGSTQPAQPSLFGSNLANQQPQQSTTFGAAAPTTINVPAAAPIVLGSDVNQAQIQMALLDAQIAACPYGDSPMLKMTTAKDTDETPNPISMQRQLKFLAAKSAKSSPLSGSSADGNTSSASLNGSLLSSKTSFLPVVPPKVADTVKSPPRVRSAAIPGRDLNYTSKVAPPSLGKGIRTKALNSSNSMSNRSLDGSLINKTVDAAIEMSLANGANVPSSGRRRNLKHLDLSFVMQVIGSNSGSGSGEGSEARDPDELPPVDTGSSINNGIYSPEIDPREVAIQRGENCRNGDMPRLQLDGSACEESMVASSQSPGAQTTTVTATSAPSEATAAKVQVVTTKSSPQPIVSLSSPDYFTEPTLNAMREMVVDGKVILNNGLTIGRATYGSVFWPGKIELENVALDELVVFRHKEVTVYPDESKKPPLGQGLNRPAEVTLERVWYIDRTTKEEIRDPLKLIDIGWRDRLEKVTARMGATFKDYRPSTGSWVFRVEHFSKYGLPDDDDDNDVATVPQSRGDAALPVDISMHELNTSLEEHHLQSHVQRARVPKIHCHAGGDQGDHEVAGLGGRMDVDYDDESIYEDYDIANWKESEVPEKKPKMEEVLDYVFEESKRLMDLSSLSARPVRRIKVNCKDPSNVFQGGMKASELVGYQKSKKINAACVRGSTCRVSWSQGGHFAFSLQPSTNEVQVCVIQFNSNVPKELIIDMLEHNIRLSRTIRRNASTSARVRHGEIEGQKTAPRIKPSEDVAAQLLDSFLATATQSERFMEGKIWSLCRALFPIDKSGNWMQQRSRDVGAWLRSEVASLRKKSSGGSIASQVWSLLCTGEGDEALRVASEGKMFPLTSIFALAMSNEPQGQKDCADMIQMWQEAGELGSMEDDLIKIYLVLAGKTHVEFHRNRKLVKLNCLEGLDWRQAFGIHLWWINCGDFLEDAVDSFSEDVSVGRAASPESHVFEQLIRLACSPSHPVEAVLDAAALLSANELDSHLSWHLWSLLRALGYNTMPPAAEQRLHTAYSSLLCSLEQWHLAVFVLSHISHDQCRTAAIRGALDRMALTARSHHYERILAVCDVPTEWISAAKFVKAKAQGNFELACSHALSAGDYSTALRLFAEDVAPNAIAMGDFHKLRPLAERMEESADKIQGWGAIGQIYADYCIMRTMDEEDDAEENERFQQLIESISVRIKSPIFKSSIQRLCMKTMARELFEIQQLAGKTETNLPLSTSQLERLIY
ncbi:hypothetical protein Q1695_014977 [Nippostrongylus brasiliensis]|nr:hypothetical protein Q1695_014977 [Nippostrongylus brasiliensis]